MAVAGRYVGGAGTPRRRKKRRRVASTHVIGPHGYPQPANSNATQFNPLDAMWSGYPAKDSKSLTAPDFTERFPRRTQDNLTNAATKRKSNPFKDVLQGSVNQVNRLNRPSPSTSRGVSRAPGGRRQARVDALDQMLSQLMGSVGGTPPNFDYQKVLDEQLDAINNAYNIERRIVKRNNRRARQEVSADREELEDMYTALSRQYKRSAGRMDRETNREVKKTANIYNTQAQQAENTNTRLVNQQAQLLQNLGIEDAGQETIPGQMQVLNKELSGIRKEKSQAKKATRQRGEADESWLREQSGLATEQGIQGSLDLQDQLREYLFNNRNELMRIQGERGQALASAEGDLAQQSAQMQQDYENAVWDRLMDVAGFKMDVDKMRSGNKIDLARLRDQRADTQFDNALDLRQFIQDRNTPGSSSAPSDPLAKVAQIASQAGKQRGTKIKNVFDNLINTTDIRAGFRMVNGEKLNITAEEAAAMATEMGRRQGLTPSEIMLLRRAVLDYF